MRSVALAVSPARSLTSPATTAKPLPASPARAASMVALSASRLVWSAMVEMLPAIWSISAIVAERRSTVSALSRDPALASCAVVVAELAAVAISVMAERSPAITVVAVPTLSSRRRPASTSSASWPSRTAARCSRATSASAACLRGPRPLGGELGLRLGLGDRLLLGPLLLRPTGAVRLLGELPAVGEEGGLGQ